MVEGSPSPECRFNNDIYTPEKIQLSRINVNFYRVGHDMHTWESCRSEVENMVKANAAVILERAPMCEGIVDKNGVVSKETMAHIVEIMRVDLGKNLNPDDPETVAVIQEYYDKILGSNFFSKVENCAANSGKRIILIDPYYVKTEDSLDQLDDRVDSVKKILTTGGLFGTLLMDRLTKVAELKKDKKVGSQPISRRRLLQGGIGLATSLIPGLSHRPATNDRAHNAVDLLPNLISYDLTDYRNTVIAEGLSQLNDKLEPGSNLGAIYGAAHAPEVKDYVLSPKERAARLSVYAPFKSAAKPHARIFDFTDKGWSQVDEWDL